MKFNKQINLSIPAGNLSPLCNELARAEDRTDAIHTAMRGILHGPMRCPVPVEQKDAVASLHEILKRWDSRQGDLAGQLYLELQSKSERNSKGQYFTPVDIVEDIIAKTVTRDRYESVRIFDPACGSGLFLVAAFRRLLEYHLADGHDAAEASRHIINRNLFGNDTDATALEICAYNLLTEAGISQEGVPGLSRRDYLATGQLFGTADGITERFDIIVGNPPWGGTLTDTEKKRYRREYSCARSGINTFTLFMERSLDLLNEGGHLGFLVPEAYLNIKAHSQSRKNILSATAIEEISLWGEQFRNVFAPAVSIILRKDSTRARETNVVRIAGAGERAAGTARMVPQKHFAGMHDCIFNINYSGRAEVLMQQITGSDSIYLENNARFFLGIVTGDNERLLFDHYTDEHPDPIIRGRDLRPYRIESGSGYFRFNPAEVQQAAPESCYRTRNKFLYRFIGSRLTFALDREGVFSLNNVNGFIPTGITISNEAMLAMLNSSLMQYYYQNSFFTVKVLRGNLEKLPLRIPDRGTQDQLARLVQSLENEAPGASTRGLLENIDDIVFHAYGINDALAGQIHAACNPDQTTATLIN